MDIRRVLPLAAAFLFIFSLAEGSADGFFTKRLIGTLQLQFTSNSSGVQVAIDDQNAGTMPLTVYVLPGNHKITFLVPGEQPKTTNMVITADMEIPFVTSHRVFMSTLTVNTNVPEASITIDGNPIQGNQTQVSPGQHLLTAVAPGYQTSTMQFIQRREDNTINLTLVANTFPLKVKTNVPGAALAVDGNPINGDSVGVIPGAHTLTVSAPGYQTMDLPFNQPSSPNFLNVTLVASTGTLVVNTDQLFDARTPYRLYINGNEVHRGPQILPAGTYTVQIMAGTLSSQTTVTLAQGQTLTLSPSVQWSQQ